MSDGVNDCDDVGDPVSVGVELTDTVCVTVGLRVGLGVIAALPEDDCEGVPVRLPVAVALGVVELLRVAVELGVPLVLGVSVGLPVFVCEGEGDGDRVLDGV